MQGRGLVIHQGAVREDVVALVAQLPLLESLMQVARQGSRVRAKREQLDTFEGHLPDRQGHNLDQKCHILSTAAVCGRF